MATRNSKGWRVPELTDRADVPQSMADFADDVAASVVDVERSVAGESSARIAGDDQIRSLVDSEMRSFRSALDSVYGLVHDTGWRELEFDSELAGFLVEGKGNGRQRPFVQLRRVNNTVFCRGFIRLASVPDKNAQKVITVPVGFRDKQVIDSAYFAYGTVGGYYGALFQTLARVQYTPFNSSVQLEKVAGAGDDGWEPFTGYGQGFGFSWPADGDFPDPDTLPGAQVTAPYEPATGGSPLTLAGLKQQLGAESSARSQADTTLGDRSTALERRASSLESNVKAVKAAAAKNTSFVNGSAWKARTVMPNLAEWSVEGSGIQVVPSADGQACVFTGTLRNSTGSPRTIQARGWRTVGNISPAPQPKPGLRGCGLGQLDGKVFEVDVQPDGSLRVWSFNELSVGTNTSWSLSVSWTAN